MSAQAQNQRSGFVAATALLLICLLSYHSLLSLAHLAFANPEYSHILLVPLIVGAFLFLDPNPAEVHASFSWSAGVAAGICAATFLWLGRTATPELALISRIAALVCAIWGVVLLIYGWNFFRANLFPILLLLLLIPWPSVAVGKLTEFLQAGSTSAAYWFFKIFGVPVTREGFVLSLPSIDIEVAQECSGIRSTVMLMLTALVLGQWFLRSNLRKFVLVIAVLPIGILRNGLRIFVLSVLGTYVNPSWLEGSLHHRGGALFFLFGLGLVIALLWLFRRGERLPPRIGFRQAQPTQSG